MISVFFNCSSPYVGYRLLQADYVQEKMVACSEKEMTPTGYKLFNSSGSYMLLGTVHNRKYFHSCESQSVQYDEQGRPIYNNIAFLAGSVKDTPIINRIAAYVFFNREEFDEEIAKYITLLDDGYTVDFKALSAFLKRFEQGCQIQAKSPAADRFFREIQNSIGSYEVDFIVRQSTWNYFIKQVGRDFTRNEKYNMSDTQGEELASEGTVVFKQSKVEKVPAQHENTNASDAAADCEKQAASSAIVTDQKMTCNQEPVQKDDASADNEAYKQERLALQNDCNTKSQLLAMAEEKAAELRSEVSRLKETIKKSFLLGLAVGVIGTIFLFLLYKFLSK